ncbi:MAG: TonB-dependent receptor [Candidatus Kryptoniota bacterium]
MRNYSALIFAACILLSAFSKPAFSAGATVRGHVKDLSTGEPLPGANVLIVGTVLGASTDLNGKFVIMNVPPGTYSVKASYVGYKSKEARVTIKGAGEVEIDFQLEAVGIQGREVVVTAQAAGQNSAINQQLSSDRIVNVVSAARIQELPDANAAESVGRLPGISVLRNGGEGTEVVVRGLAPKFSQITIDGIQMASTSPDDRSTDISMISSNMLDAIQVSKTVTPDMDANVIGGTVNFELREARTTHPGVPEFSLLAQGGYNNLPDVYNKFNNYKYVGSAENRFLNDKLGIFAQIDVERKNLTSNELGANYDHKGNSTTDYITTAVNLYYIYRDIVRYNGALVADYKLPDGQIKLSNLITSSLGNVETRSESFGISSNSHDYVVSGSPNRTNSITNGIKYEQAFSPFYLEARISHTYSEQKVPDNWSLDFLQNSAGLGQFNNQANIDPRQVPVAANNILSQTYMNYITSYNTFSKERALSSSVDLKAGFKLTKYIGGEIKFGGMYRYQTRLFDQDVYDGGGFQYGGAQFVDSLISAYYHLPPNIKNQIPITLFADPNFRYGKFLGGDYVLGQAVNLGLFSGLPDYLKANYQSILANNGWSAFVHDSYLSTTNDYSGHENQSAVYVMSTLNIGEQVTAILGIRYQDLSTTYMGSRGIQSRGSTLSYNHYDTTVVQDHGYWLPDISLKWKPASWFDIRLSYTNTIAYPDYNSIIPRIDVAPGMIQWNNYRLSPSRSTNYDAYISFYDNTIGLFTIGGFLKQIKNLIYPWFFYVSGTNALQYFPASLLGSASSSGTYQVVTFVNNTYVVNDYGVEMDWQTHFWYLPGPLSGLVLSANYTHIFSKAQYPYTLIRSTGRTLTYIDTSFTDRLLYQPDNIANLSIGFDYRGFSIRLAMLYQADIFTGVNFWPQLRTNTAAYRRWDLAFKQSLPIPGVELYGDLNNINGAKDVSVLQLARVPQSIQDYGMTADVGLRWKF